MYSAPLKHVLLGQRVAPYLASKSLLNERSGLSFVADDMSASVKGHTTNYDGDANGLFTYTSPSTKYIFNSAGILVPGTTLRCDYDPVTLLPKGLLIEEQRTNLALRSADLGTTWGVFNATNSLNAATAPDGTATADKIVEDATTNEHGTNQNITIANTTAYTWSVYAKAGERSWIVLNPYDGSSHKTWFDLANGVVGTNAAGNTASIQEVGGGWYRCIVTRTSGGTSGIFQLIVTTADNTSSYAGDITKGVYFWGAQLEAGSFPTSYIPTAGSTVTRAADAITLAASKFPLGASHTLLLKLRSLNSTVTSITQLCNLWDGSTNERFGNYMNAGTARLVVADGGVTQADMNSNVTVNNGNLHRIAWAADTNDVALVVNGGAAVTDTSATMPTPTTLTLSTITSYRLTELRYRPRRVPNAQLQAETA